MQNSDIVERLRAGRQEPMVPSWPVRRILMACAIAGVALMLTLSVPDRRIVLLPPGVLELASEMAVGSDTEVRGSRFGTVVRAADGFRGRALIVCRGRNIRLSGFAVDGNRAAVEAPSGLPPSDRPFAQFTLGSGVLAEGVSGFHIEAVAFREIAGFAVLVSRGRRVSLDRLEVEASGGRNPKGRNNTTGGVLLEEGTLGFTVTNCRLRGIRGNGIWTHSLYTSPRNSGGLIARNIIERVGRDAIQVGHATNVRVIENRGREVGFPVEDVDMEVLATPVALDTAGNVDRSLYARNRFDDTNGKCIDLDGFHHGEIRGNVCINPGPPERYPYGNYGIVMNNTNPDMQSRGIRLVENEMRGVKFGGIFVIGEGHTIARNRFLELNTAHCNEAAARFGCDYAPGEPDMLRSGIYLARGAGRPAPARGNLVEDNQISGFQMDQRCVAAAPGIAPGANTVRGNRCTAYNRER